jgi:hypothetical protein
MRCLLLTLMVHARAHAVLIDIVVLIAVATEFESSAFSLSRSCYGATDSFVDKWTRVFQILPYLEKKLFELYVRRMAQGLLNACTL